MKKGVFDYIIFLMSYYSHLQRLKVKSVNNKQIPQGKVIKRHWSLNVIFGFLKLIVDRSRS